MSQVRAEYFAPKKEAEKGMTAWELGMLIDFLETELEHVERGPQSDDYLNLWRKIATLKVRAEKMRLVSEMQARVYELEIRKARAKRCAKSDWIGA